MKNSISSREKGNDQLTKYLKWIKNSTQNIVFRYNNKAINLPLSDTFFPLELSGKSRVLNTKSDLKINMGFIDFSKIWPQNDSDLYQDYTPDFDVIFAESVLSTHSRIVILGSQGSGKTTILMNIANLISRGILGDLSNANERLGIIVELPIPILIPINAFGEYLTNLPKNVDPSEKTLLYFIERYMMLRQANLFLESDFFSKLIMSGKHIAFLMDGLDEIADDNLRIQISRAIQDLANVPYHFSFIVTSRTAAYQGECVLPSDFWVFNIKPLTSKNVFSMIEKICNVIYKNDSMKKQNIQNLVNSIEQLEENRKKLNLSYGRLIDTALMVRIIITLYLKSGQVANRRTDLYRAYIDTVLQHLYYPDFSIAQRVSRYAGSIDIQRRLLTHLAFEMHKNETTVLSENEVNRIITSQLEGSYTYDLVINIRSQFIASIKLRGGIFESHRNKSKFTHLAFQEFLTGQYLVENLHKPLDIAKFFKERSRITKTWWKEPALHTIGLLYSKDEMNGKMLIELFTDIGEEERKIKNVYLSALRIAGESCIEYKFDKEFVIGIAHKIESILFNRLPIDSISIHQLVQLGRILGVIGDTRMEVSCSIPHTIKIQKGSFFMGHPLDFKVIDMPSLQSGVYVVELDEYWIGKYPVTVYQFGQFIQAGGYEKDGQRFWTRAGWEWKKENDVNNPAYWKDPTYHVNNYPIIGVSWFEAIAYSNWLSETTERNFRLPTEAEWEKAAGGRGIWPWGSDFSFEKTNTSESHIGQPTCVGLFKEGGSKWGIMDCAGNVWEWCNSQYRTYDPYDPSDNREETERISPRIIRGGSWLNNKDRARVANRDHYFPGDRHFDVGFRIAEDKEI